MSLLALNRVGGIEGDVATGAPPVPRSTVAGAAVPHTGAVDTPVVFANVSKTFPSASGPLHALQDISLSIEAGRIFGIIGRSGAGKSTLVRTINRLETVTGGQVLVNGVDVGTLNEDSLVLMRRRIGMIFQHFNLLSAKTVWDNVALPLKVAGVAPANIHKKVTDLLALVGLSDKKDVYPAKLSGGQKQRVGIARALVHDPDILLCDEATSALDPETTQSILALLRDINRRLGLTVVLITHEMAVIREICDRVAVLEHGRLIEQGEVWRVFGDPQHAATRALLRPLVHDLPADLSARLVDAPPAPALAANWSVVIGLRFTGGEARAPDLGAIAAALGDRVQLLHGGIDRIQGRAQGRMLLSAASADGEFTSILERAKTLSSNVEVVGYVAPGL